MNKKPGTLVISLDFELMWGMFDKVTIDTYGENIRGVHAVIPKTLELFSTYDIHATWATVGMLMYPDKQSILEVSPDTNKQPQYSNQTLSAYNHLDQKLLPDGDPHYFAPALVKQIVDTPGQELASHTFSHYYCLEEQTGDEGTAFVADCRAMQTAVDQFNTKLTALVFPRNQWNAEAHNTLTELGFKAFRGTEDHFIYHARSETDKTNLMLRGLRFLDRYLNLTGHHTYTLTDRNYPGDTVLNIPASRQLHPYSKKLFFLESVKIKRAKAGMTKAAKQGEIFHLWWHPHNFGSNQSQNFAMLLELLNHYQVLKETYGMQNLTMTELATQSDESIV